MGDKSGEIPVLKPGVEIKLPGDEQPKIDDATRKLYEDTLPKTVQITTDNGVGSGFFMDKDGTVGTAAHVIMGSREQFAITSDGTKYKLQLVKLDDVHDSAILKPVGLTPGSRPYAEMGSSTGLKNGDAIYPMGHPQGLRPAYISPGTFNQSLTQQELFKKLDPAVDDRLNQGLETLTPKELPQMLEALKRPLLFGNVHIRQGDSGGPMFDKDGKVIGVNDMISGKGHDKGYFVPIEKMRDLYNSNDSKFQFTYNRLPEPSLALDYKNAWLNKPITAATETAGLAGLGYIGYRGMMRYPRAIGIGASLYETSQLLDDAKDLLNSTDRMDKLKFGVASAADVAGVLGGIALASSRYRVGGAIGLAVGIGGRMAAELIPTRLVLTDIQRKSDPTLPPLDQNIEKKLGL
jgi:hypothetical protein